MDTNVLVYTTGAIALAALVIGGIAFAGVQKMSRRFSWVSQGDASSVDTLPTLLRAVESNQQDVAVLKAAMEAANIEARSHFKRLGIVRYNAFDGVAGQQSYSLCLLDENKNGILISNLVGTNFARGYAVEIRSGEPARPLGDEEKEALGAASKNGN
ncbi:MAG: DUF4446 family protein [Candidatus Krumholzibacteria bacterium]|nr:DUF4446 family protein [Candidatus Krumholzibacteria bacterium]MDH4336060.1 DUF4446 family protein [Candidatus Krumholzibacteria bacterium]MDH5268364.1 DUF4446 family protein [Candidatus Krumholzibacteria bacterium]MDH5627828.1 DUF4446 family protein [Candidatus Krumholzibacteria bacterium]